MEAYKIYEGEERGVKWTVDTKTKVNPVTITVKSDKGEETCIYNCQYEPIFGYDVSDVNDIENLLDELINKYAIEEEQ